MSRRAIRFTVLTISDRRSKGDQPDESGPLACEMLEKELSGQCAGCTVLADDQSAIEKELIRLCESGQVDLIVTTGGTGLSPRDVTPEATRAVIDREAPGMAEAIRAAGVKVNPRAMLSRAVCGQRGKTLIINLSGSPRAVREQLNVVLPVLDHAIDTARGKVNNCGSDPCDSHSG